MNPCGTGVILTLHLISVVPSHQNDRTTATSASRFRCAQDAISDQVDAVLFANQGALTIKTESVAQRTARQRFTSSERLIAKNR
jgi:hypothetical protein